MQYCIQIWTWSFFRFACNSIFSIFWDYFLVFCFLVYSFCTFSICLCQRELTYQADFESKFLSQVLHIVAHLAPVDTNNRKIWPQTTHGQMSRPLSSVLRTIARHIRFVSTYSIHSNNARKFSDSLPALTIWTGTWLTRWIPCSLPYLSAADIAAIFSCLSAWGPIQT